MMRYLIICLTLVFAWGSWSTSTAEAQLLRRIRNAIEQGRAQVDRDRLAPKPKADGKEGLKDAEQLRERAQKQMEKARKDWQKAQEAYQKQWAEYRRAQQAWSGRLPANRAGNPNGRGPTPASPESRPGLGASPNEAIARRPLSTPNTAVGPRDRGQVDLARGGQVIGASGNEDRRSVDAFPRSKAVNGQDSGDGQVDGFGANRNSNPVGQAPSTQAAGQRVRQPAEPEAGGTFTRRREVPSVVGSLPGKTSARTGRQPEEPAKSPELQPASGSVSVLEYKDGSSSGDRSSNPESAAPSNNLKLEGPVTSGSSGSRQN